MRWYLDILLAVQRRSRIAKEPNLCIHTALEDMAKPRSAIASQHAQKWDRKGRTTHCICEKLVTLGPAVCHILEHHRATSSALAGNGNLRRIAAEKTYIILGPLQRKMLIQ